MGHKKNKKVWINQWREILQFMKMDEILQFIASVDKAKLLLYKLYRGRGQDGVLHV